ncbi:NAD(P)-dependent oxidoreductase [Streptomyces lydicus]|uniref:NAD(P)-dependent oxidoreductase n=1 Tax=Streptomyces lydicus TaxID=47763 RepID=UPI00286FD926|nr:NAD(P)H-binding protein [Streptomyces lydicus]
MSTIALFGANGSIGSRILNEALQRGHRVTAVVRDPAKITTSHPDLTVTTGDVLAPAAVAAVAEGHDVVVSAVGGGDGPGHVATIRPAAESLVAGLRTLGDAAPRLITDDGGVSRISTEDYAVAVLDEIEQPRHLGARFTVGY